ncbi:MAG: Pvc16 family protein [Gaiellales bacterium]
MATTVISVPLNTMLADLDESLRGLLRGELSAHGFDGVDIVFDAPTKDWAASLSTPTVNIFLFDVHEAEDQRVVEWDAFVRDGRVHEVRPPLRLDACYAVTAWTRAVEDEHRLLSQVLGVLYAHAELPQAMLAGTLRNGSQPFPVTGRVAQRRADGKADFWSAVGGQYKASLDYVVTLTCAAGGEIARGPQVRTRTARIRDRDVRSTIEESHGVGGTVAAGDGSPAAGAWVALPELGLVAVTGADGRFRFPNVPPGRHRCQARGVDGTSAEAPLEVPGAGIDLVLAAAARRPRSRG